MKIKYILGTFIFILAFTIRLIFIVETLTVPAIRAPTPGLDVDLNQQAARIIASGASTDEPYFEPMMLSTPLYSYWLAFCQKLLGDSMLLHRLINVLLASLSAVLIFFLINRLVQSSWIAFVCACTWAALPSLIYFDSTLHKSALEIFIFIGVLFIAGAKRRQPAAFYSLLKGVLVGLLLTVLLLIQLNTFLYAVVFFIYFAVEKVVVKKEKLLVLVPAIIIFSTSFLFFQFRSDLFNQRYPWFLPTKGFHAAIGFHKGAHGAYHQLKDIQPWPYGHTFYSRLNAETMARHTMTAAEADRFYLRQTLNFISTNPKESLGLIASKVRLFFNNFEVKGIDDLYYFKNKSFILAITPSGLGMFVVFAGLGILRLILLKEYRLGFLICGLLGCILVSNIMTFVTWRYRLLNVVPLCLLASHGLKFLHEKTVELFSLRKPVMTRLIRYALLVLLPLLICGWTTYAPIFEKERKGFYMRSSTNDRLSLIAVNRITRLKELESTPADTVNLRWEKAFLLNEIHRHSDAYRVLKGLHDEGDLHPYGTYKYVLYQMWLGDYEKAIKLLQDILRRDPMLIPDITRQFQGVEIKAYQLFIKPYLS